MKIAELTQTLDLNEQVRLLSQKTILKPDVTQLKHQWEPKQHKVMDKAFLKDKDIYDSEGNYVDTKPVNRVSVPFQKKIVNTAVVFGFGNEVELSTNEIKPNSDEAKVLTCLKKILEENKTATFNRRMARECYRSTEVAEIWYYTKSEPHNDYGFTCNYRIKVKLLTPWNGDELIPHFDSLDRLISFVRKYNIKDLHGKSTQYCDIYTDEEFVRLKRINGQWVEDIQDIAGTQVPAKLNLKATIGKIPVIYGSQEQAEWSDVQSDIERLELLFSRHAEINDYHSAPKIYIEGELSSAPQAGEANGILQGAIGTKAYILSWNDSPESIKLEINTRLANIYKFTNTPDVSFESVKGLNQISGVMLRMLFMDAHLKVLQKEEIWDEYLERRFNLLKSFIGNFLNPNLAEACRNLTIKPKFNPYMIDDLKDKVNVLMTANGNKPIISQEKAVELLGLAHNPMAEFDRILKELERENTHDIFQPTNL